MAQEIAEEMKNLTVEGDPEGGNENQDNADTVTPWTVTSTSSKGVDYGRLLEKFGCQKIDDDLLKRFEQVTGKKPHPMLRRGLFFAHRDLSLILDQVEQGKPFFLYTGRGPSSGSLHLGHFIPFMFTRYLQEAFDVPLVVQVTDDEKFLWKDFSLEDAKYYAHENIKDIIACGFDPEKTFIFTNTKYMSPAFYENILRIANLVTINQVKSIFGISGEDSMGKAIFPAIQAAPCFSSSFPQIFNGKTDVACLIPAAIDQDPYFRMTRDVAPRLNLPKPAMIYSSFLPSLQGAQSKMAASDANTCVYMSDTPEIIKEKMTKYAFSGGKDTVELHRKYGGDCETDTSFQYLRYFMESDENLEEIRQRYTSGEILSGELKAIAVEEITKVVVDIQKKRKAVTDDDVKTFTTTRKLKFNY